MKVKIMILFAGLICVLCLFHTLNAAPADGTALESEGDKLAILGQERAVDLNRQKRATCDILGGLKHSACAAHCLLRGNRGGYCDGPICRCRN